MVYKGVFIIMSDMQDLGEIDGLKEYVEKRTKDKDEIIEDLRAEDKRLNEIIINLHNELGQYDKKIKKQHMVIGIQWDIIACLMELKGVIEDE